MQKASEDMQIYTCYLRPRLERFFSKCNMALQMLIWLLPPLEEAQQ